MVVDLEGVEEKYLISLCLKRDPGKSLSVSRAVLPESLNLALYLDENQDLPHLNVNTPNGALGLSVRVKG